jgi:integrase
MNSAIKIPANPIVAERLRKATALVAGGLTLLEAADALGVTAGALRILRNKYNALWNEQLAAAPKKLKEHPKRRLIEPRPEIAQWIRAVVAQLATGETYKEAAATLEMTHDAIRQDKRRYRAFWEQERAKAGPAPHPRKMTRNTGLADKTIATIGRVAFLLAAQGHTVASAARIVGIKPSRIEEIQRTDPTLWENALQRALAQGKRQADQLISAIQAEAGRQTLLEDPDAYIERAERADRICRLRGIPLFPGDEKQTITTFFETYYLPTCLFDARECSVKLYRIILRRWRLITGDPPLENISNATLTLFREALTRSRGIRRTKRMSPHTIVHYMSQIQTLLDKCGPPGRRNRDAADILQRVPWVRPPKAPLPTPRIVPVDRIGAAYLATPGMDMPRVPGIKAPAWWRALLALTYNTGFRKRTLFEIRMDDIHWQDRLIIVPAERLKSGRPMIQPLNDTALGHLRSIRTDRALVFPWPHAPRIFWDWFHKLQDAAGIPRQDHFGLHNIRKTAGTEIFRKSPAAAQLSLGHTTMDVTQDHYVNGTDIVAEGLSNLAQPAAFVHGLKTESCSV